MARRENGEEGKMDFPGAHQNKEKGNQKGKREEEFK